MEDTTMMTEQTIIAKMHELEQKIEYRFNDIPLLAAAMNATKDQKEYANNVMATVGDCILKAILSTHLYETNPNITKGKLTDKKQDLEKNATLAKIMELENLRQFTYNDKHFYSKSHPTNEQVRHTGHDPYIEALVFAIYQDSDYTTTQEWVIRWLYPRLEKHANTPLYLCN